MTISDPKCSRGCSRCCNAHESNEATIKELVEAVEAVLLWSDSEIGDPSIEYADIEDAPLVKLLRSAITKCRAALEKARAK